YPFLRWAGGKQQIVEKLVRYAPADVGDRLYYEPFLGAGSLYFRLSPHRARLSDANEHLIRTYRAIASSWPDVAEYLAEHASLNLTAYFTHYTTERFNSADQERLADTFKSLDRRGCLVMMTNANTKRIRELYKDFRQVRLPVTRFITCKAKRYRVGELVILNY